MRSQDLRYRDLELLHHLLRHFLGGNPLGRRDRLLQRSALIHRRCGDHAPFVGKRDEMLTFTF
jgi:hypothetical protein